MKLEIRHLKLIRAIATEGSVTRAGDRLHLTQSALSHQLRDAEEKLGVPLFTRLNKRMILTPAGQRLLNSAESVLDEMKRAEEDIRQIARNGEGVLRLSTQCYTCYHWLPSMLKLFQRKFPRIDVQIMVEATRRPIEALLDGKLDLAIVSSTPRNQKLTYKPLFQDEMVAVMKPDYPLATRPFLRPQDFADQHLLVYAIPREENTIFQKFLTPAGVTPKRVSHVQLTEAVIEMVRAGLGLSVLARWAVAPQLAAGTLHAVPLSSRGLYRKWSAAMLKNKSAPAYLHAFIELLANNTLPIERKDGRKRVRAQGLPAWYELAG
ncbi:MAG TPA: LysR family transcriptional regulator [Pyrinomonadaceae bacterium]|jgi:LysR family transcriptional regulator for metE and metH|nr:LysR family transcriptional regulator [Pyrinomonadaceae bacterium]